MPNRDRLPAHRASDDLSLREHDCECFDVLEAVLPQTKLVRMTLARARAIAAAGGVWRAKTASLERSNLHNGDDDVLLKAVVHVRVDATGRAAHPPPPARPAPPSTKPAARAAAAAPRAVVVPLPQLRPPHPGNERRACAALRFRLEALRLLVAGRTGSVGDVVDAWAALEALRDRWGPRAVDAAMWSSLGSATERAAVRMGLPDLAAVLAAAARVSARCGPRLGLPQALFAALACRAEHQLPSASRAEVVEYMRAAGELARVARDCFVGGRAPPSARQHQRSLLRAQHVT